MLLLTWVIFITDPWQKWELQQVSLLFPFPTEFSNIPSWESAQLRTLGGNKCAPLCRITVGVLDVGWMGEAHGWAAWGKCSGRTWIEKVSPLGLSFQNIFTWCGSKSNILERNKARDLATAIRDSERKGKAKVEIIADGEEPAEMIAVSSLQERQTFWGSCGLVSRKQMGID